MTKAPSFLGLELIKSGHNLEMSSFDSDENTNRARSQGQDPLHVKRLATSMESSGFDFNEPLPIAVLGESGRPVLIDGHHRRDAWASLGNTTLPCNYYKLTGMCSLSDIIIQIGLKANDHKPVRSVTQRDIERAILEKIEREDLNPSRDEIMAMLKDLNLTNFATGQYNSMTENIYKRAIQSNQVRKLSVSMIQSEIRQNPDLNKVDTWIPVNHNKDNTYAFRSVVECVNSFVESGNPEVVGLYALDSQTPQHVFDSRSNGVRKMEALFDNFRAAVRDLPEGSYPWDVAYAYPQVMGLESPDQLVKWDR